MPLVTTTRGASVCDGKRPMGWPLYMTRVCSSVIWLKYCMVRRYWAQF